MARIIDRVLSELRFAFSRSGGAGGQNVNKVATKVTLEWDFERSEALSPDEKHLLRTAHSFSKYITKEGIFLLSEQSARTQKRNRDQLLKRFGELLARSLKPPRKRVKTKVSHAQKEKRLVNKKVRSERKRGRFSGSWD